MIRLDIEHVKPGMILEHPVRNTQGVLLLEAGARITKKNIRIFKSWGVKEISVKGQVTHAADSMNHSTPQQSGSEEMQLKEKFADVLDDPVMVEIFKAASRQLNKNLSTDESNDAHS